MGPKGEILTGCTAFSLACVGSILYDIYVAAAFIAAISGAILGLHGLYQLARSKRDKHKDDVS